MSSPAQRLADRKAKAVIPRQSVSPYPAVMPRVTLDPIPLTHDLFVAQQRLCFHCLEPMAPSAFARKSRPNGWSREHVIPRSKGGKAFLNVVLAHQDCNSDRGDADLPYAELLRARLIILAAHIVRERRGTAKGYG